MGVSIQIIRKKIKKEKIFIFFMCVVFEQYYLPREVKVNNNFYVRMILTIHYSNMFH